MTVCLRKISFCRTTSKITAVLIEQPYIFTVPEGLKGSQWVHAGLVELQGGSKSRWGVLGDRTVGSVDLKKVKRGIRDEIRGLKGISGHPEGFKWLPGNLRGISEGSMRSQMRFRGSQGLFIGSHERF